MSELRSGLESVTNILDGHWSGQQKFMLVVQRFEKNKLMDLPSQVNKHRRLVILLQNSGQGQNAVIFQKYNKKKF